MTSTMTDRELQDHVEDALGWEPSLDAADVGVNVDSGVVTLRGEVGSYAARTAAERVALGVYGVKAVANDITVRLVGNDRRTDTDIAQAAVSALKRSSVVPSDRISATVSKGWITLTGVVDLQYQKEAAARAVRDLVGVRGVTNDIALAPRVVASDVRDKIEGAFKQFRLLFARALQHDDEVRLPDRS